MNMRRELIALFLLSCCFLSTTVQAGFSKEVITEIVEEVITNTKWTVNYTGELAFKKETIASIVKTAVSTPTSFEARLAGNNYWHFYDEQLLAASRRVYKLKERSVLFVTRWKPNNPQSDIDNGRRFMAQAFSLIFAFYTNTNWIELGNTDINRALGKSEFFPDPKRNVEFCNKKGDKLLTGVTGLTSFYRNCNKRPKDGKGKCCQKALDKSDPKHPLFATAKALAKKAAYYFMAQLREEYGYDLTGEDGVRTVMDYTSQIFFVIDVTNSMKQEMPGIHASAQGIVDRFKNQVITKYTLLPFTDGEKPIQLDWMYKGPDPVAFVQAVKNVTATRDGGSDCHENGYVAIDKAIKDATRNSTIFFWSDASQRGRNFPWSLFDMVSRRVKACLSKRTKLELVLTGRCSPFRLEGFHKLAQETGGSVYKVDKNETGNVDFGIS